MALPSDQIRRYEILGTPFLLPLDGRDSEVKQRIIVEGTLLFAQKGYLTASLKELAEQAKVSLAELYEHFPTKDALWHTVLNHAVDLYLLYFRHLDEAIAKADSFEEVLEALFAEPKKFTNYFTCFAFDMIHAEQFRDELCRDIFRGVFLDYSIKFIKDRFDACVKRGLSPPFDTGAVAAVLMNNVLMCISVKVNEIAGRPTPYDPSELMANMQKLILAAVGLKPGLQAEADLDSTS